MSEKLLKAPTFRCDSGPASAAVPVTVRPDNVPAPRRAPADMTPPVEFRPGLPMASTGVGVALSRDAVDAPWRQLLDASKSAGIPLLRLAPEQAEALVQQGVPSAVIHRLAHGYPATPLRMGALRFFPAIAQLLGARRLPVHFYVAEAFDGEHVFKRRLRQSLGELDENVEGDDERSDDDLDVALLAAATRYIEAFGARPASAQDAAVQTMKHWLPGAEAALHVDEDGKGGATASAHVALLGPLMSWEDYRAELERRLMVARLWCLLGIVAAVAAFSRSGALSSRLLLAFGALGILGGGLGFAPWLRTTTRLRELVAADPTLRDTAPAP